MSQEDSSFKEERSEEEAKGLSFSSLSKLDSNKESFCNQVKSSRKANSEYYINKNIRKVALENKQSMNVDDRFPFKHHKQNTLKSQFSRINSQLSNKSSSDSAAEKQDSSQEEDRNPLKISQKIKNRVSIANDPKSIPSKQHSLRNNCPPSSIASNIFQAKAKKLKESFKNNRKFSSKKYSSFKIQNQMNSEEDQEEPPQVEEQKDQQRLELEKFKEGNWRLFKINKEKVLRQKEML